MDGSAGKLVSRPLWSTLKYISTTNGWVAIKFDTDSHLLRQVEAYDFGEALSFSATMRLTSGFFGCCFVFAMKC